MSDGDYFFARVDPFGGGPVVDDLYRGATGSSAHLVIADGLSTLLSERHARAHAERRGGSAATAAQLSYWAALDRVAPVDLELATTGTGMDSGRGQLALFLVLFTCLGSLTLGTGRFVVASGGAERAHASALAQYVLLTLALVSDAERAHDLAHAADLMQVRTAVPSTAASPCRAAPGGWRLCKRNNTAELYITDCPAWALPRSLPWWPQRSLRAHWPLGALRC
jgi:hypothetical protein